MGILVPQLDGSPHAGDNCGPASICSALRWATRHEIAPEAATMRRRMKDREGGTHMSDHRLAWNSYIPSAMLQHMVLHPMVYHPRDTFANFMEAIGSGYGATLAIDYSLVPPYLKCSRTFDGFHSVFVAKLGRRNGKPAFKVYDPLADGRRADVPRGALWYPLDVLRECAGGVAGKRYAMYNLVEKATPHPHRNPDAEPTNGLLKEPA